MDAWPRTPHEIAWARGREEMHAAVGRAWRSNPCMPMHLMKMMAQRRSHTTLPSTLPPAAPSAAVPRWPLAEPRTTRARAR
jgi:hypothetical protein